MKNNTKDLALPADPQRALEVTEALKAIKPRLPEDIRDAFPEVLGGLTRRDIIFYQLGEWAGRVMVVDSFDKFIAQGAE